MASEDIQSIRRLSMRFFADVQKNDPEAKVFTPAMQLDLIDLFESIASVQAEQERKLRELSQEIERTNVGKSANPRTSSL